MLRAIQVIVAAVMLVSTMGWVQGSVIVQSTLQGIPGTPSTQGGDATEVDYWYFSVNTAGPISIDILSWQWDRDSDGTSHFMDPFIYLFNDDGTLDAADLLGGNDDSGLTFGDGSTNGFDSYLSIVLGTGDYVLAISDYSLSLSDAVAGINFNGYFPAANDGSGIQLESDPGNTLDTSYADYQITFDGDVTVQNPTAVPEPSSLALLGIGACVAGVGAARRRRCGKKQGAQA